MYNLTVDKAHTYFVGDGQWLVHNACSSSDIRIIEKHLSRLDHADINDAMINRLKAGEWTPWDQRYAEHELLESPLMDDLIENGYSVEDAYDIAHPKVLQIQGLPNKAGVDAYLYHPDVISEFPEWFNAAAKSISRILSGQ